MCEGVGTEMLGDGDGRKALVPQQSGRRCVTEV